MTAPRQFEAEFLKRAKAAGIDRTASSQFDAATYDIVLIYAEAMKQRQGHRRSRKARRRAHRHPRPAQGMKDFPALEGAISFGANGDALKPVYVIEMKDGKWKLLATYPADK